MKIVLFNYRKRLFFVNVGKYTLIQFALAMAHISLICRAYFDYDVCSIVNTFVYRFSTEEIISFLSPLVTSSFQRKNTL